MKIRPDGGRRCRPAQCRIIRRNLRNASMTPGFAPAEAVWNVKMALKASRKPIKLRGLAWAPSWPAAADPGNEIGRLRITSNSVGALPAFCSTVRRCPPRPGLTRLGYVIDDGPRNEAPRDANCGVSRPRAVRPVRDVLVSQPGRLAPGSRGADS